MPLLFFLRTLISLLALSGMGVCVWLVSQAWEREDAAFSRAVKIQQAEARRNKPFLVVVDAGHGGMDGGTKGHDLQEKDVALDLARRVAGRLRDQGCQVKMTREDDTFVVLEERSAIASRLGADVFVSIHLNADASSAMTAGVETYYSSRKRIGDGARLRERLGFRHEVPFEDERSARLARIIQRRVCSALGASNRGARDSNYLVVMLTECPAVLVECGYLTNAAEAERFKGENYRDLLAGATAGAVMDFLQSTRFNPLWGVKFGPPPAGHEEASPAGVEGPASTRSQTPLAPPRTPETVAP